MNLQEKLRRQEEKNRRQFEEMRQLRRANEALQEGAAELSALVDALMAGIAMQHGKKTEDGWELTCQSFKLSSYTGCEVSTERTEDGGFIIRVTRKEPEPA